MTEQMATFAAECEENLSAMEVGLLALEHQPDDPETVAAVFRAAHNIKGTSRIMGLTEVGEVAHVLEEAFQRYRDGKLRIDPAQASFLLRGVDVLRGQVARGLGGEAPAASRRDPAAPRPRQAAPEEGPAASGRTLRVDLDRLDGVVKLLGEIVISRGGMEALLADPEANSWQTILESHRKAERLYSDLRDLVMQLRMVKVGPVLEGYRRTVRDVSQAARKQARLVTEGGEVEIDANLVESLRDPLNHMVRNAVDHGLEGAEARRATGKPEVGVVTLRARREGGAIAIDVSDDGRGLDRERIWARAVERGLVMPEDRLSDDELFRFIFHPGFSTAEVVTDISGRGVGMDVVRRNVEAMRGDVTIHSRAGAGTTMTLRVPMTLAIISGFHVAVGGDVFVLPLEQVVECLPAADVLRDVRHDLRLVDYRGRLLPCVDPRALFELGGQAAERPCVVVVSHGDTLVAVTVDQLLGESQTVVKPLGPMFDGLGCFSGSTITGGGAVALILEIGNLVAWAGARPS